MDKSEKARFELEERVNLFEGRITSSQWSNVWNGNLFQPQLRHVSTICLELRLSTWGIASQCSTYHEWTVWGSCRGTSHGWRLYYEDHGTWSSQWACWGWSTAYHSRKWNCTATIPLWTRECSSSHTRTTSWRRGETAEQFRQQRERLQQECHDYVAEKEEMNRQEMASITSRLAASAEMVMVNN